MLEHFLFHHVGVATLEIDKTADFYLFAGYNKSETFIDAIQGVKICFMSNQNSPLIELVSPINEDSPVSKIIQKSGVTPYHFCYEVDNLKDNILKLRQLKFITVLNPVPAIAFENRFVCFMFHKHFGLIELLENNTKL